MALRTNPSKLYLLSVILKDPERKSLLRMSYECCYLLFLYKELPLHYFSRILYRKNIQNIRDYLPNKLLGEKITPFFNNKQVKEVLDNKLFFDFYYRQFNISLPKILMYNHKRVFVIENKDVYVNSLQEFIVLLKKLFSSDFCDSILIKKTCASSSGLNIYKLTRKQVETDPETINELYCIVIKAEFLFQEMVKQHPELNKINNSCVNTIRLDTFIDAEGKIDIISGFLRMSITNAYTDNVSTGGCFVSVDIETGKLGKFAYSKFNNYGPVILKQHPVTKTVFENFEIPFFPEAKQLVIKAARMMPGLRLVGWDVAIGEHGPVLIEGNSDYEIRGSDFANGGYRANPAFRKVLHELNYI